MAVSAFTLSWTHSVEKTHWQETWTASPDGLRVIEARIEGSGAGMDPPPDAVLRDGAYVYRPQVPPITDLVLGASGATGEGWTLCGEGVSCRELGAQPGDAIHIGWCRP
ncbi:DUF1850 domain-containing protein [Mangrovicella endophytica]|uniref:DUF1850 domain-containing protein n=1 Tax=Mangrovicella endophytica TaxID=2066697 RepID=UPI001FE1ECC6|nr:DUF1850 domain-containing protein [Mangrovicella endophytica]